MTQDTSTQAYIDYWRDAIERGEQMSWGDLAELTHETQVGIYGFCLCEDNDSEENPYPDCPPQGEPRYV